MVQKKAKTGKPGGSKVGIGVPNLDDNMPSVDLNDLIFPREAIETSKVDIPSTGSVDSSKRSNDEFLLLSVDTNSNTENEATNNREHNPLYDSHGEPMAVKE